MANVEHNTRDTTSLHPFARRSESDPGAIGAGKGWFKLSTGELKVRNAANDGWVAVTLEGHAASYFATDSDLDAHTGDTSDAHDASAISFAPAGTIASTNVQAAIEEAASEAGGGGGAVDSVDGETGAVDLTDNYTPLSHVGAGGTAHANAVAAGAAGFMTGTEKTKLNGIETGATADMTPSEILSAILTVDGSGSGLDADTLDGHDTAYFAQASHNHAASDINSGTLATARLGTGTADGTTFLRGDQTWAVPSGGSSGPTVVPLGSDVTNSTTTIADVTGLSFSITSGTMYRFYALIYYTSAATTTGSHWTVSAPTSPTAFIYRMETQNQTSLVVNFGNTNDNGGPTTASNTSANIATIEGLIKPSSSGTLQIRFASEVAASAIVAKAGSTLTYW